MEVSRMARTHLMYQFIIIALMFLCIGYYEFLLEKRFIFVLALGFIFLYQLSTLACHTELLQIASSQSLREFSLNTTDSRTENGINVSSETWISEPKESKEHPVGKFSQMDAKNTNTEFAITSNDNHTPKHRTYKFRNWQTNCFTTTNQTETSAPATCTASNTTSMKKSPKFTLVSGENRPEDSELTKTYFFPYRQKRLEEWLDSKGNGRPYKIRGRVPNIEENFELDSQSKNPPIKTPQHVQIPTIDEAELRKSYSFPFRQKRTQQWKELVENSETSNTPSMPYWQSIEDSISAKQKYRRRRSFSFSHANNQQLNLMGNNDHREFSQSLEISGDSHAVCSNLKKNSPKASNGNFSKIKMGILNCFSKTKKENSRANLDRKQTECKTRLFKTYFHSRENLQDFDDYISLKTRERRNVNSNIYPGYVPFAKRSFVTL